MVGLLQKQELIFMACLKTPKELSTLEYIYQIEHIWLCFYQTGSA